MDDFDPLGGLTAFDLCYRNPLDAELTRVVQEVLLRGRVLTVEEHRPATEVAKEADVTDAGMILVVDKSTALRGYIFPDWVTTQVSNARGASRSSLEHAVDVLAKDPLAATRDHFHEWLNFTRPSVNVCPGRPPDERAHTTVGPVPCWKHR